ncbi:MAG: DMT family transporter [Pseudomonadota bacterium]
MKRAPLNSPLAGATWMLLSCLLLTAVSTLARHASLEGVPLAQIVFLRLAFALVALSPLIIRRWPDIIQTDQHYLYGARILCGLMAMVAWFGSLALSPVGDVTAISFLTPLISTVGAVVLLGEVITKRRTFALALGLLGTLIILRPGLIDIGIGTWIALLAACGMAAASLMIKCLTARDDPDKVVAISTLFQTPIVMVPAILVWQWPTWDLWLVFAAMGVCASLGQVCLSRAFASAEVGLVMGIDFSRLPFAVLFGYLAFGELIDLWTWIGAVVILFGVVLAARGKAQTYKAQTHKTQACKPQDAPRQKSPAEPR